METKSDHPSAAADNTATAVDRPAVAIMAVGLVVSVLFMAVGLILAAFGGGAVSHDGLEPGRLLSGLDRGDPAALVMVGLVVLLATPLVRLAVLAFGLGRRREWLFVGLTGLVLAELTVSALLIANR